MRALVFLREKKLSTPIRGAFNYARLTASGNASARPAAVAGVFCAASTGGTCQLFDDSATGTAVPLTGQFLLVAGTYYQLPALTNSGLNIVLGGTADITVFFEAG